MGKQEKQDKWEDFQEAEFPADLEQLVEDTPFFQSTLMDIHYEFVLGKPHTVKDPTGKEYVVYRMYAVDKQDDNIFYNIGFLQYSPQDIEKDEDYEKGLPITDEKHIQQGKMHIYKKVGDKDIHYQLIMNHLDYKKRDNKVGGSSNEEYKTQTKEPYSQLPVTSSTDTTGGMEEQVAGEEEGEEEDLFTLSKQTQQGGAKGEKKERRKKPTHDDIFDKDPKAAAELPPLPEESEESLQEIAADYKEETKNRKNKYPWIVHLTKNTQYSIHPCNHDGNCYFEAVIAAFRDKGLITTVEKLRNLLATEVTKAVFDSDRQLYESFENAKKKIAQDKKIVTERMAVLAKYVKRDRTEEGKTNPEQTHTETEREYRTLAERLSELKQDVQEVEHNIRLLVPHMAGIKTLEQYRDYIRQTGPGAKMAANDWVIQTLERKLEYKSVLFFEENYSNHHAKQNDTVVNLVEPADQGVLGSDANIIKPKYYILFQYQSDKKYELVRYRGRGLLTFQEMPYGLKARLVTRSLEKLSSSVNKIQDFIQFKAREGFDEDTDDEDAHDDDPLYSPLYADKNVVFAIYSAAHQCKVGTTPCNDLERMPKQRVADFLALNRGAKDWRRRLSDDWMGAAFKLDKHTWDAVTHYVEAAPYRDTDPAFYAKFTKGNAFSEKPDPSFSDMARQAGSSKKGTMKNDKGQIMQLRQGPLRTVTEAEREVIRKEALHAKIMQNADIRRILENTRDATLKQFQRGRKLHNDNLLMQMRTELLQSR